MPETALRVSVTRKVDGGEPNSGPPVVGAKVFVHQQFSETDDQGKVVIPRVHVSVYADGFTPYVEQPYDLASALAPAGDPNPPFTPVSLEWVGPQRLPRIYVDGLGFRDESGNPWTWAMMSGFRDYQRFLRGDDLRPILQQARDLGANGRRVLGMFDWSDGIGPFHPQDHADYYTRIPEFLDLLQEFGQYVEFTVFADTGHIMAERDQIDHFNRVCDALRQRTNGLPELVNENDAHENHVDIARFPKPEGLTSSAGSNGGGSNPPGPYWDFSSLHAERRDDRIALTPTTVFFAIHGYSEGADSFAGTQRATVNDEDYGFDEVNQPGRRTNDPEVAYLMGVGCGYGAGGTAHTTDGIQSELLRPIQAECTRRFLNGVKLSAHGKNL